MFPKVSKITEFKENISTAILIESTTQIETLPFSENEKQYLQQQLEKESSAVVYQYPNIQFIAKTDVTTLPYQQHETARMFGAALYDLLSKEKISSIQLCNTVPNNLLPVLLEGLLLSVYSFDKYKKEKPSFELEEIFVADENVEEEALNEMLNLTSAVFAARDLVNEPLSFLTAPQFSKEIEKLSKESGFTLEVFNKKKIESLKMGGLLAVNKGSIDPPTFNILEWKPENAKNERPIVLVGKGIVFDTGGLSLKPTANSMDFMKTDMAGAAVVAATLHAIALNKLPLYVVALIPATDNRPDGNAYAPGDVITMYDGTTVEIKNTDAEGRLILADALTYAKKYNPELVIDYATLTGSADIIAGQHAAITMGNTAEQIQALKETGFETYERLIEVPLWDEYAKVLKSNIADLNNLGTREGQTTIAGKFLEHFTDYNWIHIDSAGTPFLKEKDAYRPAGGTGFGTRLLYHFLKKQWC